MSAGRKAHAIMMPHNCGTVRRALGPVATSGATPCRRIHALRIRTGQDVMHIHAVAAAADRLPFLPQGRLFVYISRVGVQVLHAVESLISADGQKRLLLHPLPWTN